MPLLAWPRGLRFRGVRERVKESLGAPAPAKAPLAATLDKARWGSLGLPTSVPLWQTARRPLGTRRRDVGPRIERLAARVSNR